MKVLFLLGVILSISCTIAHAREGDSVRVLMKNDSLVVGTEVRENNVYFIIRSASGELITLRRTDIQRIERNKPTVTIDSNGVPIPFFEESGRMYKLTSFTSFGGTVGTPAGINMRIGSHGGSSALHLSGMYWGDVQGMQISIMNSKEPKDFTQMYAALLLGYLRLRITENNPQNIPLGVYSWTYAGIGLALHSHGFFAEVGVTTGVGNFTTPVVMLQLGFMPRRHAKVKVR